MARKKVILSEVAELAGVGIATVDRLLNERGNVKPETALKIIRAARQLGLQRILPATYHKGLRLEVILARPYLPLIKRMNQAFMQLAPILDRSVTIQRSLLKDDKAEHIAERIRATTCNAVIIYAQEDPAIIGAVGAITAAGIPVITVISDLPTSARFAYAGIDHYAAGRTAGYFMAKFARQPGRVIALCYDLGIRGHADRIRGLTDAMNVHGAGLKLAERLEGRDDSEISERLLVDALKRHRDIVGVYNAGAPNDAVELALRKSALQQQPIFIGHELTPQSCKMLQEGTMTLAIDQNPQQQARLAVDILLHHFGYAEHPEFKTPYSATIDFTLHGPENVGKTSDRTAS